MGSLKLLPIVSAPSAPSIAPFLRLTGTAAPLRDDQDLLLDRNAYGGATILLAAAPLDAESAEGGEGNLPESSIRVVMAPAFGPVFLSEAVRLGILLVALPEEVIERLIAWAQANPRHDITVDLEAQLIDVPGLGRIPFETPPRVRQRLLHGLGDLDELLQHREEALAFRAADLKRRPWLYAAEAPPEPSDDGSGG